MSFIKSLKDAVLKDFGSVKVYEFGGSDSLDAALTEIIGNYPISGWAVNTECDMMYLVVSGKAKFYFKDESYKNIKKDSAVFISKGVPYRVEVLGSKPLRVWMPSSPHWSLSQYKQFE